MIYDVDYFIGKFKAIPEELWCVWEQFDSNGRSCAFGHCNQDKLFYRNPEYNALYELGRTIKKSLKLTGLHETNGAIADINNGVVDEYQQPTPKQRVLAALYDLKKLQQPAVKERTVYVTVDQPVRDLQKKVELKTLLN